MLAEAEEEDSRVRNGGGSPHVRKMPASIKPTALASKYGVDVPSEGYFLCPYCFTSLNFA